MSLPGRSASLALLAACALAPACATTRFTQSRIEAPALRAKGSASAAVSLEIEGLKLRVETLDRVALPRKSRAGAVPVQAPAPRLALRIIFEPRELGYFFDPGQVVLKSGDGRESRPASSGYAPLHPGARFDLVFDTAVGPGEPSDLVIGGLSRGPRRLGPATLRIARREGRAVERMYWLEAIGYGLSILTYPYGGM